MDAQFTGTQISQRRKALGLTQKELAEKLHVTDKAVSKWERGINFPDLGLLENLARALDTTPAMILGLENASQAETLATLSEISQEQLEDAQENAAFLAWCSIGTAFLLCIGNLLARRGAGQLYTLFRLLIPALSAVGLISLFRCGQVKKWGLREFGTFCAGVSPVLIWIGYQFFTGHSLHPALVSVLIVISVAFVQIHFLQVMKPKLMQLLPLVLSVLYLIWNSVMGGTRFLEWILPLACLSVLIFHSLTHSEFRNIHWANAGVTLCFLMVGILILCTLCWPMIARSYLLSNSQELSAFAKAQLVSGEPADHYGPFEVSVYPELGMVQFHTGSYGLAPESTYEGMYYSASGDHVCFPGFAPSEDYGATALFRDPTVNSDNRQKSTQITQHLYWFELHY